MTDTQREFEKWYADTLMVSSDPETIAEWAFEAGWQDALAHSQQYEAVGAVVNVKAGFYPLASFNTADLKQGEILYVKREAITNRKDG